MPDDKKGSRPDSPLREEDAVSRLTSAGSEPGGVTAFVGLLGRSPKEGYWLLYLGLDMNRYIEIRGEDVVHSETLTPERSPFGSLGGTRLYVKRDATVVTSQRISHTTDASAAADEFDLDIRLGAPSAAAHPQPCMGTEFNTTCGADCGGGGTGAGQTCLTCASCGDTCFRTCNTCRTVCGATCVDADTCLTCRTCQTQCGGATCQTCQTRCNQATCQTCQTQCGTCQTCRTQCGTCQTCQTQCGQRTCNTCRTQCGTCPDDTCAACTHVTCFRTCDAC